VRAQKSFMRKDHPPGKQRRRHQAKHDQELLLASALGLGIPALGPSGVARNVEKESLQIEFLVHA
jgi:hypothetical protein